jgi:hypothetical protein
VGGRLNLMVGEENISKSTFAAYVAAAITRGELPGVFEGQPGKVLFVGADEDDWSSVTLPRLMGAGADMSLVHEFYALDDTELFNVDRDSGELSRLLGQGFALVVFEHLMDVLPRMPSYTDPAAIRRAVRPLRRLLAARDTAGLGTLHVNKAEAQQFRQRTQGSVQWGAMVRSAFLIDRHPDDPLSRVVVLGKANYVPDDEPHALSFRIEDHPFSYDGQLYNVGRVVDVQAADVSMADVLAGGESSRTQKRREQREAVLDALTDEPQSVRAIARAADVPKSSAHDVLVDLQFEGRAQQETGGWRVSECPSS